MKKQIFALCFSLSLAAQLAAKDRVIENPVYDFNTSGVTHISRIELAKDETRVYIHTVFLPNWWVSFSQKDCLEDPATGQKWRPTAIRNGEFDKHIFMPASGDSTFILVYPKLDKSIKKINFIGDEADQNTTCIYGISLDPKAKRPSRSSAVPAGVQAWIDGELAKARRKTLLSFEAGEFFVRDTARIVGYIKGYDPRAGFTAGMVYASNDVTRENLPRVAHIHPDGRFECSLPLSYPQGVTIHFRRDANIEVYLQPGTTLSMVLDWEEFRAADRLRNISYIFSNIRYGGAAASVNRELTAFYAKHSLPARRLYDEMSGKEPDEYKALLNSLTSEYAEACRQAANADSVSPLAKLLLQNSWAVKRAAFLLEYSMHYSSRNPDKPLPATFYDFLQDIPVANPQILSTGDFSMFINRLEYLPLIKNPIYEFYRTYNNPEKSFEQYLFDELGIQKTPDDVRYLAIVDTVRNTREIPDTAEWHRLFATLVYEGSVFSDRYQKYADSYQKKYVDVLRPLSMYEIAIKSRQITDSIYTGVLKLRPGIVGDLLATRELDAFFAAVKQNKSPKVDAEKLLAASENAFKEEFLREEARRLFYKNFPPEEVAAYELPNTEEAEAFKKIVEPFRGKYVLVDFWATWCGPCIAAMKQSKDMRERYKDSRDVAFVFITSDKDSPTDRYSKLVEEQALVHTYRVAEVDYLYFRQLFAFNGIPHYVLIDRQGRVINRQIHSEIFEETLKELLAKEETGNKN
ncbi:MAG: TlpA family protein disulfide reductase [Prevotellaceae bacterium]|nr:TlpA family protein disulfide reductase [Prevotellaceae bacterium]